MESSMPVLDLSMTLLFVAHLKRPQIDILVETPKVSIKARVTKLLITPSPYYFLEKFQKIYA
jgi:hypothetical protein